VPEIGATSLAATGRGQSYLKKRRREIRGSRPDATQGALGWE
jgi:hypothetical protein